jgi:endonuclease YncB( thermonuclease family)
MLYGTVTEVRDGATFTFQHDAGAYEVRLNGIEVPAGEAGEAARRRLMDHALGQQARIRFKYRSDAGEMVSRLWVGDRDIAQTLLREGVVRRRSGVDEKYGELEKAEAEARAARRGVWAQD